MIAMLPKTLALVSTVFLLMSLGFFVLGATPLLILKHDVPMDSRVIRQVFHYCYRLVTVVATTAAIGYGLSGRAGMSLGFACIAVVAIVMHHWLLTRMDSLRNTMHEGDRAAVSRFR
ncbi:MAG TPA: hypothetical protein VK959_03545, partial [Methylophilaceae bacterium]|nr:hypothetical protein [Methylophilaceae bacterium]